MSVWLTQIAENIERSMECRVPEKTRNQTNWAIKLKYYQNGH